MARKDERQKNEEKQIEEYARFKGAALTTGEECATPEKVAEMMGETVMGQPTTWITRCGKLLRRPASEPGRFCQGPAATGAFEKSRASTPSRRTGLRCFR